MADLPYQIAVLCYLFDADDRILLLHRHKAPNLHLYSPVGGKLETGIGESPTSCAIREIREETGIISQEMELHLTGIVSERSYQNESHWLMFLYELTTATHAEEVTFDEGRLVWCEQSDLEQLPLPSTDREVIWPLFWRYRRSFFAAHIDCAGKRMKWRLEQPASDAVGPNRWIDTGC